MFLSKLAADGVMNAPRKGKGIFALFAKVLQPPHGLTQLPDQVLLVWVSTGAAKRCPFLRPCELSGYVFIVFYFQCRRNMSRGLDPDPIKIPACCDSREHRFIPLSSFFPLALFSIPSFGNFLLRISYFSVLQTASGIHNVGVAWVCLPFCITRML